MVNNIGDCSTVRRDTGVRELNSLKERWCVSYTNLRSRLYSAGKAPAQVGASLRDARRKP